MDAAGDSSNAATAGGATADETKTLLQQQNASMENDYDDGNDADEPQALPFCFVRVSHFDFDFDFDLQFLPRK